MDISVKTKFRKSAVAGREGVLCIQLIHRLKIRFITTSLRLFPNEWDASQETVRMTDFAPERQPYLQLLQKRLDEELRQIHTLINVYEKRGNYTIEELVADYVHQAFNGCLFTFADYLAKQLQKENRPKTASIYHAAKRSFSRFRLGEDIRLENIDGELLKNYEKQLKNRELAKNTVSFYMRTLRSIYNQAVKKGLCVQRQPFTEVYTGIDKTVKRAVDEKIIIRLKQLDLSHKQKLEKARDLFLFSFYMRGISFVDMANLTLGNLKNGYITYIRSKTKQKLTIKIEECMQVIIEKYACQTLENFLLPIYSDTNRSNISCLRTYNKQLQRISKMLELEKPLSSYLARHSWATIALRKGISVEIISESMGHENEATTRIYLASLEQSVIDKANATIILLE
jgi:site-specific recombinase XerD